MPELAEVAYFCKQWKPGLNQPIRAVHCHSHSRVFRGLDVPLLQDALKGATLRSARTHGKQMLFGLSRGNWLGIHLGMTGQLRLEPADFVPGKHDHLVLFQARHTCVFSDPRHFGRIRFDQCKQEPDWWRSLPPEPHSPAFTIDRLAAFLQRRTKAPLKAVLLMQECFPGIGNWMADEILWQTHLHPLLPAGKITPAQVTLLHKNISSICRLALDIIGTDWSDPPDSWLFNHRWNNGRNCPRCYSQLLRRPIGGRTTCFCPTCQRFGRPTR